MDFLFHTGTNVRKKQKDPDFAATITDVFDGQKAPESQTLHGETLTAHIQRH